MTRHEFLSLGTPALELTRLCTEAEYLAIGETVNRVELIDGRLLASPAPSSRHQDISWHLKAALRSAAREAKLHVTLTVNVRLGHDRLVIPDLVVADIDDSEATLVVDAADVVLVGEVISSCSADADHNRRRRLYGKAGIDWYLLAEPDLRDYKSIGLRLFRLRGDRDELRTAAEHRETLIADQPFPIAIHTEDLLKP